MARTVYMLAVKQVEVSEEFEPLEDREKRLAFANMHGQVLNWAKIGESEVVNMTLAPTAEKLIEMIESTYSFKPMDGVDIGTADLVRSILSEFLCVDLRPAVSVRTIDEVAEDRPYLALETDSPERWTQFMTQHSEYKEA